MMNVSYLLVHKKLNLGFKSVFNFGNLHHVIANEIQTSIQY